MKVVIGTANFLKRYGLKKEIQKRKIKQIFSYCKKNEKKNFDTAFSYDNFKNIKGIKFDNFKIFSIFNEIQKL